jgi:hypothetical protein
MQWPRDVDRLPNGHTLVAGTHGDRVFELDRTGEIVWSVSFPGPYDAERLSTPSESGGGPSATAAELGSREVTLDDDADSASTLGTTLRKVKDLLPSIVLNGLLFLLPPWVTPLSAIALVLQAGILFGWAVVEAHHRYAVSLVVPVRVRRR